MRRLAALLAAVAVCAAAIPLAGAGGGGSDGPRRYRVVLDNAFGLIEGSDLQVAGVRAGKITKIKLRAPRTGPPRAVVEVEASAPGTDLYTDASCKSKPQSLVGEYFLDCQPGSSRRRLPDGGSVPVERTESTIPQDLVNNMLRRPARERLRLLVTSLGMGVAGRPQDLQAVLRRAHPGLRETTKTLRILGDQNRTIDAFIRDADTVVGELEANKRDVVRFIREAGDDAEIAASRREALREGVRRLPAFLGELRPTLVRLRELADEGTPLLGGLRRAGPDLNTLLARLGPFAREARPALRALGRASPPTIDALREGRQEVRELRRLGSAAPTLAKPLRQLLDSLDDRRRAIENDPRAARSGPPAPDPTHTDGPEGFTGFESIANYFFWQSMTTNGFDRLGHLLRVSAVYDEECSPFANRSLRDADDERFYRKCRSWMGPNQPGLTAPDPSAPGAARLRSDGGRPPARAGERRGPGQPDAGPLPGQRDVSRPRLIAPPDLAPLLERLPRSRAEARIVEDILDGLSGGGARGGTAPAPPPTSEPAILDYLLGP